MDSPSLRVTANNFGHGDGGPSSGGNDNGGHGMSSSPMVPVAASGVAETFAGSVPSLAPNLQVANEPTTTADSRLLVTSPAARESRQPNAESENNAVVGQHALNSAELDNSQQELAVPVEVVTAQDEAAHLGGENVVVVGAHAAFPNSTDDLQQVHVEVARQGGASGNFMVGPHGRMCVSIDDNSVGVVGQGPPIEDEPNSGAGESIGGPDNDGRKRTHDEAPERETRGLQERNSSEGVDESSLCPICMEPWTNSGDHRVCCLACGHLFGKSCIRRWLRQAGRKVGKCPQCNKRAKLDDLRPLYVPRTLAVADGEVQQEVRTLKAENRLLKLEIEMLRQEKKRKEHVPALQSLAENSATHELRNVTTDSHKSVTLRTPPTLGLFFRHPFDPTGGSAIPSSRQDQFYTEGESNGSGQVLRAGPYPGSSHAGEVDTGGGSFHLQYQVSLRGGKVFDIDAGSLTVILSNKTEGGESLPGLSKMSLLSDREIQNIVFPSDLGAIRDIRLSPSGIRGTGKCAVVASSFKKLSVLSLDSNNIVLTYSLPSPPWSCAWDPDVPYLFYSGLQNGSLLVLDLRQTASPLAILSGVSNRPIHSLQAVRGLSSVQPSAGAQPVRGTELVSASNSGISHWSVDSSLGASEMARPQFIFSHRDLVCISLIYECSDNTAVASFRRSPSAQNEPSSSSTPELPAGQSSRQPLDAPLSSAPAPAPAPTGWKEPSHWIFSRSQGSCCAGVNESIKTAESRLPWEKMGAMEGNKSRSLMTRTAIIPDSNSTPRSKSLFACGDEGTNSVWLWDINSCTLKGTLVPHQSPILDVKNVRIQGTDMLGCVSDRTFQIYRRG